jgi:hypothetical protein
VGRICYGQNLDSGIFWTAHRNSMNIACFVLGDANSSLNYC